MKVAIYGQNFTELNKSTFLKLAKKLEAHDYQIFVESQFSSLLNLTEYKTYTALDTSFKLLISIGGDGTILRAATTIRDSQIPMVGINTGRLGFLATIPLENFEASIDQLIQQHYTITHRNVLQVSTSIPNEDISKTNFALNEITVSRNNTASMIIVETHLDNEHLTSYWADGLIVATPTGSTGYSLSCGGPVITPESKNIVLTPIAPHNLNARPLVVNEDTQIRLKVDGREKEFLISLDSRIVSLSNDCELTISKAPFQIKLIELNNSSFLQTLRKKLLWGEDKRN